MSDAAPELPAPPVSRRAQERRVHSTTFRLAEVRCRGCAGRLRSALAPHGLEPVFDGTLVRIDSETPPATIAAWIREAGFEPEAEVATFPLHHAGDEIDGSALHAAITSLSGVTGTDVDATARRVTVHYLPSLTDSDGIRSAARRAGYRLDHAIHPATPVPGRRVAWLPLLLAIAGSGALLYPGLDHASSLAAATAGGLAAFLLVMTTLFGGGLRTLVKGSADSAALLVFATIAAAGWAGALWAGRVLSPAPALWLCAMAASLSLHRLAIRSMEQRTARGGYDAAAGAESLASAASRKTRYILSALAPLAAMAVYYFTRSASGAMETAVAVLSVAALPLGSSATAVFRHLRERLAHRGIDITTSRTMESLGAVTTLTVLHDTLFTEPARISHVVLLHGISRDEVIALAAAATAGLSDDVSVAIRSRAGTAAPTGEAKIELLSPGAAAARNIDLTMVQDEITHYSSEGRSSRVLVAGGKPLALLATEHALDQQLIASLAAVPPGMKKELVSELDGEPASVLAAAAGMTVRSAEIPHAERRRAFIGHDAGVAVLARHPDDVAKKEVSISAGNSSPADVRLASIDQLGRAIGVARLATAKTASLARQAVIARVVLAAVACAGALTVLPFAAIVTLGGGLVGLVLSRSAAKEGGIA